MICQDSALSTVRRIQEAGFLSAEEVEEIRTTFLSCFAFADAMQIADSIHVNVKVDDVAAVPAELTEEAARENEKEGYVKYAYPNGVNFILSSIDISQDDLLEARNGHRRPRPFLDHLGIDLRRTAPEVKNLFNALPYLASKQGWPYVSQGGDGQAVFCCHVQVDAKHWVFPRGGRKIPLEFAFGPLVLNETMSGCDLRPADPQTNPEAASLSSCCGS